MTDPGGEVVTGGVQAGPSAAGAIAQLVVAAVLLAGLRYSDAAGAVLLVPVALVVLGVGLRDLLLRPVLAADATGLVVVDGLRRRALDWPQVERLRVVTDRRTPVLEVDLGETVVVLTRRRLGRPPGLVLEQLEAVHP